MHEPIPFRNNVTLHPRAALWLAAGSTRAPPVHDGNGPGAWTTGKAGNGGRRAGARGRKDMVGQRLMHMMSKPRRPRKIENPDGTYWFEDPERLKRLHAYCRRDVEVKRELYKRLRSLSPNEQTLWELSCRINERGFHVDRQLADAARRIAHTAALEIDAKLAEITGGAVTRISQISRLTAWLLEHGCPLGSLDKKAIEALLATDLPPLVQRVLELRRDGAQAAVRKMDALLARVAG